MLSDSFAVTVARVGTVPYIREGTEKFLAEFGPGSSSTASSSHLRERSARRKALEAYNETLDRLHLDGFVYPATQMPPPDGWVNMIGVPAIVVPGGFYPSGLPFGLELSARPWKDGDLIGWAYAYEQATHHRRPPILVEKGLLQNAK